MSGNNQFPNSAGFLGQRDFFTDGAKGTRLNAIAFVVRQIIAGKAFAALVKVQSCTNSGGLSPVGTVVVQPMVHQIDGFGNTVPHGNIYALPYFRLQGGSNAIILDPQAGDIGLAVFCDRDISKIKTTKAPAAPDSRRQNDWADGCYFGGFLNGTPTQYVQFLENDAGINIVSPGTVSINAPVTTMSGELRVTGEIYRGYGTGDQVDLGQHTHGGIVRGGANTNAPNAGT